MQIRPRRSVLYMPGSNARALEKAKSLAADALILDLEDAVAPEAKETARKQVCAAVRAGGYGQRELVIRINALDTPWGQADLRGGRRGGARCRAAAEARRRRRYRCAPRRRCARAGAPDKTRLWAMIETPLAILNLREIAAASRSSRRAARLLRAWAPTTSSRRRAPTCRPTGARPSTGCRPP